MTLAFEATLGGPPTPTVTPLAVLRHRVLNSAMVSKPRPPQTAVDADPADLLAAIAANRDREAFKRLFAEFAPRLKAFARRMGAQGDVADDLAQEVMLTVWRRAGQFDRRKAGVSTWIFTIARNRRIDMLRRERRPEIDPNDPALVGDPEPAPDRNYEVSQHQTLLRAAVAELPPEQARLLRLAFFEDKSHSVIAEHLNLPLGTVKSRIRLAMVKLRAKLEEIE